MRILRLLAAGVAVIAAAAIIVVAARHDAATAGRPPAAAVTSAPPVTLPAAPGSYLGVYAAGVPGSLTGVTAFARQTQTRPNLVLAFSGWREPFQAGFAAAADRSGAVPVIQIEPARVRLAAITAGRYDGYLSSYATAVRGYHRPVILSFGHEMNGFWYSWGYGHTPARVFVAAWRHIVSLFRTVGADNVTWLWTVNVMHDATHGRIPDPRPWWPGGSYVNWVGIDGYYFSAPSRFASLFGPTIAAVHQLTSDPVLIAETAAASARHVQALQIGDLFQGVRTFGLLGLVWFDARGSRDWRLRDPTGIAAFHRAAGPYMRSVAMIPP
jgi:Glycosyl hydrolase family 26